MICPNDDLGKQCENCTCKYKTVAVIPCFGRFQLLEKTVERLYKVNGITKVVLVGHEKQVKDIADKTDSHFVEHANIPLGRKWNAGFKAASLFNPDAVLFVGSSDWISEHWMPTALKYLKDFDMIGKLGCHLLDIHTINGKRLVEWPGYGAGPRKTEPIGIGRVISARALHKIHWEPFENDKDNSMDYFMYKRVLDQGGNIKIMEENVYSMAISTNLWPNKHMFQEHWKNKLPSKKYNADDMRQFLENNFKEALNLFNGS